eukprot:1736127-Prymnesium_polylepis.1
MLFRAGGNILRTLKTSRILLGTNSWHPTSFQQHYYGGRHRETMHRPHRSWVASLIHHCLG